MPPGETKKDEGEYEPYPRGMDNGRRANLFVDSKTGEEWKPTSIDAIHHKGRVIYSLTNGKAYITIAEKDGRFYQSDNLGSVGADVTDRFQAYVKVYMDKKD